MCNGNIFDKCRQPGCYHPDLIEVTGEILKTAEFRVRDGRLYTVCAHGYLSHADAHIYETVYRNRQTWSIPRDRVSRVAGAVARRIKQMLEQV